MIKTFLSKTQQNAATLEIVAQMEKNFKINMKEQAADIS
jgi:hypothetical protein